MDKNQAINLILMKEKKDAAGIRQFRKTLGRWYESHRDNPKAVYAIAYGTTDVLRFERDDIFTIMVVLTVILGEDFPV